MRKLKVAAVIMIIHGLIEISGIVSVLLAKQLSGMPSIFALDFFKQNMALVGVMGVIFGILRITAASKIWRNQMSGLALGAVMCIITLLLMIFMIPSGIMDGVLAGGALILLLDVYFTGKDITGVTP